MEREPSHRAFPKLIEKWDIDRIKRAFSYTAERMRAAGVDCIDFESFGHLLSQLCSPMSNHLDNEYGGSLKIAGGFRCRYWARCAKLLAAQNPHRREMIGIIDWRIAQCQARGVQIRYDSWAEVKTVQAGNSDVVVIATGGLPHTGVLSEGKDLVISAWDIIPGDVKPGRTC